MAEDGNEGTGLRVYTRNWPAEKIDSKNDGDWRYPSGIGVARPDY